MNERLIFLFCLISGVIIFPFSGNASGIQDIVLRDTVLQGATTWTGRVIIEGVVVVGRRASLTIQPGASILFKKTDKNLDGIGDGEIRVLGQLIAEGSKNAPIRFDSFETHPSPRDWSYLLFFSSSAKSRVRFCHFRHGFSGVQVHFSTVTIRDCLFEENNEGIRFGRAKLTLHRNVFQNNNIGIRFTRMEGPVEITDNQIRDNRVGIFLVPSGQNIRDFFEPGRGGKPWNEGHLAITKNNIVNNSEYNLKLGAKQVWDLQAANNWWGTCDLKAIGDTLFDKSRDQGLGKILVDPIASKPFPDN